MLGTTGAQSLPTRSNKLRCSLACVNLIQLYIDSGSSTIAGDRGSRSNCKVDTVRIFGAERYPSAKCWSVGWRRPPFRHAMDQSVRALLCVSAKISISQHAAYKKGGGGGTNSVAGPLWRLLRSAAFRQCSQPTEGDT